MSTYLPAPGPASGEYAPLNYSGSSSGDLWEHGLPEIYQQICDPARSSP
jgi:hypothetical protein